MTSLALDSRPVPQWLASGPALNLWREAGRVGTLLTAQKLTLGTAESLTGGWISAALTSVPGSSNYFMAGLATYSNEAKIRLLDVSEEVITNFGAVSQECAQAMAIGVRLTALTTFGLSTTGIAGPDGGSQLKPVGLVYVAATDGHTISSKKLLLTGNRLEITLAAGCQALTFFYEFLTTNGYDGPILV
jgi:nicotinamide-nucleotide amidase